MIAGEIGKELSGLSWLGIPFSGGMPELLHIDCRSIVVNDKHKHIINLARALKDDFWSKLIVDRLRATPFHPETLRHAQDYCLRHEPDFSTHFDAVAAEQYFISQWMGRSGKAGTDDEFKGGLSIRWTSSGGDSNTRYRSAIRGIAEFRRVMQRCNFSALDCFEFLEKCRDEHGHGIYIDAPWPDDGKKYIHKFTEADQARLVGLLERFNCARVVVRFGVHPMIQRLYSREKWTWRTMTSRTQGNSEKPEALLINGPSFAENKAGGLFA